MFLKSLTKAFDVLELLSMEPQGLKMTDISRKLDLNKTTIYRLLAEMRLRGYIMQEGSRGVYKIGVKFIELCGSYLNNVELNTEAQSYLRELNAILDQTVYMAILQDNCVVYVDKVEKYNSFRKYSIIGQRKAVYNTALGKSLVMSLSDDEIRRIWDKSNVKQDMPNTITNLDEFIEEIRCSKLRGWSFDNVEGEEGVNCISAPVFDFRLKVIAAISVSWFIDSANTLNIEEAANHIVQTANAISRRIGCTRDIRDIMLELAQKPTLVTV